MTLKKQTRAAELRPFGVTLGYLAQVAGRSAGYVKLWSSGKAASSYLDKVAADLLAARQAEKGQAA
jgi:hypothetical protein